MRKTDKTAENSNEHLLTLEELFKKESKKLTTLHIANLGLRVIAATAGIASVSQSSLTGIIATAAAYTAVELPLTIKANKQKEKLRELRIEILNREFKERNGHQIDLGEGIDYVVLNSSSETNKICHPA